MSLSFRSYRGFPCVMRCDEQLWYMRQTTAFDPEPKSTTDRYPVVPSDDSGIETPGG
jgi:hypothetical protein